MQTPMLFATDLDGTLLYDRAHITPQDRAALYAAKQAGCVVCFATGRELDVIVPAVERLQLWDAVDYFIMSGGSQIYNVKQQTITIVGELTPEILSDVYHRYEHLPISIILPKDNIFHTNRITEGLRQESELLGSPMVLHSSLDEVFVQSSPKLIFHGTADEVAGALKQMTQDTDDRIFLCRSHNNYIDCYAAGVHKGSALICLCEILNIPLANTAAIGDNHNDIELLKTAGICACPGDGTDSVKQIADFVCCAAHEGAVADFWNRISSKL